MLTGVQLIDEEPPGGALFSLLNGQLQHFASVPAPLGGENRIVALNDIFPEDTVVAARAVENLVLNQYSPVANQQYPFQNKFVCNHTTMQMFL